MSLKWKSPAESARVTYATVSGSGAARVTAPVGTGHPVEHLGEPDGPVAPQSRHHGAGLGGDAHDPRRRRMGRAARLPPLPGARRSPGRERRGYEQPSDLSLSASACRWSRHARSFSRSRATTSAGARATDRKSVVEGKGGEPG